MYPNHFFFTLSGLFVSDSDVDTFWYRKRYFNMCMRKRIKHYLVWHIMREERQEGKMIGSPFVITFFGEIRVPATTIFTKNHKKSQQITTNHTKSHKINTKNHKKKILFTTNHKKSQKPQKITSNHKKKILFTKNHKQSQTKNLIHKKSHKITKK